MPCTRQTYAVCTLGGACVSDRWLTFDELGEAMGCSASAARARALRRRWRRQTDNRGNVRVLVPEDANLAPLRTPAARKTHAAHTLDAHHADTRAHTEAELLARLAELQKEMAALAQQLATAEGRA